jgi:hypothetical protein
MPDTPKATTADAELILRLYDLRREEKMRKARDWMAGEFWPTTFEEMQRLTGQYGTPENAYFRQVTSYWEMACALVLHGALDPGLFFDTNGEVYFVYAKVKPFIPQMRAMVNSPEYMAQTERLLEGTPEGRERVNRMQENLKRFREMREQQRKSQKA